jgi:hypothetical protein
VVCAQNNGAVKVDSEFQNLSTLQSAVGFRQKKNISNDKYDEEVTDRNDSAIFTCGKFSFGQSVYDKVLTKCCTPTTFRKYMLLSDADQAPIDEIVRERIIARLIVKNSLNEVLRQQPVQTFSVNNNTCYPNSIIEAVSLLSTFKKQVNNAIGNVNARSEEAVISYHEIAHDIDIIPDSGIDHHDNNIPDDATDFKDPDINDTLDAIDNCEADVMATIIAEAITETELDQFVGASFALLQDVNDVYEDDEPDIVCYAHVVDHEDNKGIDIPDFVTDANNNAEERNDKIISRTVTITKHSDFLKDFELMVYQVPS